jgi:hypothetical protein
MSISPPPPPVLRAEVREDYEREEGGLVVEGGHY